MALPASCALRLETFAGSRLRLGQNLPQCTSLPETVNATLLGSLGRQASYGEQLFIFNIVLNIVESSTLCTLHHRLAFIDLFIGDAKALPVPRNFFFQSVLDSSGLSPAVTFSFIFNILNDTTTFLNYLDDLFGLLRWHDFINRALENLYIQISIWRNQRKCIELPIEGIVSYPHGRWENGL